MDNELSTDLLRKYVNRLADELNLGENFDIYCVGGFVFISSVKVEDGMKIVTERIGVAMDKNAVKFRW